jgi:four helix bundle protein
MAGWKSFEEIAAWQHSRAVKQRVYVLLKRPALHRDVKLATQLRESARSAPGNIAEGFGRFGNKEFARFSRIAKGSLHESLNHLINACDQNMITEDELKVERHHINKAIDSVTGLIRHLERTKGPKAPDELGTEPNNAEPDPEEGTRNP